MTERLPQGERAIIDIRKLADYCVSNTHQRGRNKARVFQAALGLGRDDAAVRVDVRRQVQRRIEGSGEIRPLTQDSRQAPFVIGSVAASA